MVLCGDAGCLVMFLSELVQVAVDVDAVLMQVAVDIVVKLFQVADDTVLLKQSAADIVLDTADTQLIQSLFFSSTGLLTDQSVYDGWP